MSDVTPGEETGLSRAIAQMCDDIVLKLAALTTPGIADSEAGYLQAHLSSLSSLLKQLSMPGSATSPSNDIQDCRLALANIKESLLQMPAGEMNYKEQMAAQMRSLVDARNTLSLRLGAEQM